MRRLTTRIAAGLIASGLAITMGGSEMARAEAAVGIPSSGLVIHGKGFGHGIGMSQWGAHGAALTGKTAADILSIYYPNTSTGTIRNPALHVRLTGLDGGTMIFAAPSGSSTVSGLVARGGDGRVVSLPAAARWRAYPKGDAFVLQRAVGRVWGTYATMKAPVWYSGPKTLRVQFGRNKGDCKNGTEVTYPGAARSLYYNGVAYSMAIVPMESYLRGVISSEMPATWGGAALQAQAVAARSFSAWAAARGYFYDVRDDTGDQCWDGAAAEHPNTNAAVGSTANQVRTYGGAPISAKFSASNGGLMAPGGRPYLIPKGDPFEARSKSPYLKWQVTVTAARLAALDGSGGVTRATNVQVLRRDGYGTWGGRVLQIRISGYNSAGRGTYMTVSGDSFRYALGMRSNYFGFSAG